jgi:DNA modification methylase
MIDLQLQPAEKLWAYREFVAAKAKLSASHGFDVSPEEINPLLKPHQRDIVRWAVKKGRAALFESFGLGKSFQQLEIGRLVTEKLGGRFLIVAPLGVRLEFKRDAKKLDIELKFTRTISHDHAPGIYITNYETVRDGKMDLSCFVGASLDEASVLRGFGGTKTFREFMRLFDGMEYKFVATATPSPNEYIELLSYAAFLEVMDVGQAKTRFFKRNSEKADELTIHPHKEREFWLWMASWAIFLQKPSDLGYSDEGYELPELEVRWHEVPTDHSLAGHESNGQGRLHRNAALGVVDAAREKRDSVKTRLEKLLELRAETPGAHRLIWHDLEAERIAIEKAVPESVSVYGTQDMEEREKAIMDFSDGKISELSTKPEIAGSGCNFQYHCSRAIFFGIGFKFNDFIQAVHRIYRFLQSERVYIDLIYTEAEREVKATLQRKWQQHNELTAKMTEIIREFGLSQEAMSQALTRSMGIERQEVSGANYKLVNNDAVEETALMESNSVGLILTSIPFSTQYEYTPSYNDFGHSEDNEQFFVQMGFLTPELLRVLQPGRICAVHVKDRIVPGGMTGLGFQTVYPFHSKTIDHFVENGFAYMGMKTIVTDVVRENNQTYRLGWTEQCKDGSKMGCGMPEYLLLFRKPPSDNSNSYADLPVVKDKAKYSRSKWQIDAHGFMRSSGNRLLSREELLKLDHAQIFQLFRSHSFSSIYDFEEHVHIGDLLELCGYCNHLHVGKKNSDDADKFCGQIVDAEVCRCTHYTSVLPASFMLLQPQSLSPEVWTDITRMRTMNTLQAQKGKEHHLCPLQFDICERVITQFSNKGDVVYDPFAGLGTVPLYAVKLERFGIGTELSPGYFSDSCAYLKDAEQDVSTPMLFDMAVEELAEVAR